MKLAAARNTLHAALQQAFSAPSDPGKARAARAVQVRQHEGIVNGKEVRRLPLQPGAHTVLVSTMGRVDAGVRLAVWVASRVRQPPVSEDVLTVLDVCEETLRRLPDGEDRPVLDVRVQALYDAELAAASGFTLWGLTAVMPDAGEHDGGGEHDGCGGLPPGPLQAANAAIAPAIDEALAAYCGAGARVERRGMTERHRQLAALGVYGTPYCSVEHGAARVEPAAAAEVRWTDADGTWWAQETLGVQVWDAMIRCWAPALDAADALRMAVASRLPRALTHAGQQYRTGLTGLPAPSVERGLVATRIDLELRAALLHGDPRRVPMLRRPAQLPPPDRVQASITMGAARGDRARIDVSWRPPLRGTPTGYEVRRRAGGAWQSEAPPEADARTHRLTVPPDRRWFVAVRARYGASASVWVVAQPVSVDACDLPSIEIEHGYTAPLDVQAASCPGAAETVVTWRSAWAAGQDGPPTYVVQWKADGAEYDPARQLTTADRTAAVTGLTPGAAYTLRVGAVWGGSAPAWGAEIRHTPEVSDG